MSLFQSNLRKQIRNLPKILNFVKKIHYYSELFTSLLRKSSVRNTVTQLGKGSDQAPAIKKESQSASESPGGRVFRIKKKSQSAAESPGGRVFLIQTTESGVLPPRSPALEGRDRSARRGPARLYLRAQMNNNE